MAAAAISGIARASVAVIGTAGTMRSCEETNKREKEGGTFFKDTSKDKGKEDTTKQKETGKETGKGPPSTDKSGPKADSGSPTGNKRGYTKVDAAKDTGVKVKEVAAAWHDARDHAQKRGDLPEREATKRRQESEKIQAANERRIDLRGGGGGGGSRGGGGGKDGKCVVA